MRSLIKAAKELYNADAVEIDLKNAKRSLNLDKDIKIIEITDNGDSYSVEYDVSGEKSIFKTNLSFNNNMSQKQWKQEYSKIRNLNLIFATIADNQGIELNESTSYFNDILSKNIKASSKIHTSAMEYAEDMFIKEVDIQDKLFTIQSEKISSNDEEYKTQITLTINSDEDFSFLRPTKEEENTSVEKDDSTNTQDKENTNKNEVDSQVENYINNNTKLPQAGKFFELKNLLQIIMLVASIIFVLWVIKESNS